MVKKEEDLNDLSPRLRLLESMTKVGNLIKKRV